MKKFLYLLSLVSLLFIGCKRELVETPTDEGEVVFSSVNVNFTNEVEGDDPDTRSLLNIAGAEQFNKATLFAFWSQTENGHTAGNIVLNGGVPCVKDVNSSSSFSWDLPLSTSGSDENTFDIYAVVNYGDLDLSSYKSNTSLTKTVLVNNLVFTCTSSSFLNLDDNGKGLPMAGILENKTIYSGSDPLTIKVKKLFARYDFYAKIDGWPSGTSFQCVAINAVCSNTEVPFFQEGFCQTNSSKLTRMDAATENDLSTMNLGGSSNVITIYFPENCQGNKSQARPWNDWGAIGMSGSGEDLSLCSYVEFAIIRNHSYNNISAEPYRLYIGTDIGSSQRNFDVVRNRKQTVGITFLTDPPAKIRMDVENAVVVPSTGTVTVDYYTKGVSSRSEIENMSENVSGVSVSINNTWTSGSFTLDGESFDHKGSITVTTNNAVMSKAFLLKIGNLSKQYSDTKNAVVLTSGLTFDGENRWYMPNVQSTDYMELVSTSSYTLTPSNFSSMEVCLVGHYYPNYAGYYGTGSGFVPCTTEFVSDGAGKYFIKVKARSADILSNYSGAGNGYYVCRGPYNRIKARIRNSSNNWVYFDLGDATIHLCLAVVSHLAYGYTRSNINGWDDDYFCIPTLYNDKFTDSASWSFDDNDIDTEQGDFYLPVAVTNIKEYVPEIGNNRTYITQTTGNLGLTNISYAPYYNYIVTNYVTSNSGTNETGGKFFPGIVYNSYAAFDLGGYPEDIRQSDWYEGLEDVADNPQTRTWRGNLFYKIGWNVYNRLNNSVVPNGGYFDMDTYTRSGRTHQCYLRFYDSATELDDDLDTLVD